MFLFQTSDFNCLQCPAFVRIAWADQEEVSYGFEASSACWAACADHFVDSFEVAVERYMRSD